jgi:hypothetical protein
LVLPLESTVTFLLAELLPGAPFVSGTLLGGVLALNKRMIRGIMIGEVKMNY